VVLDHSAARTRKAKRAPDAASHRAGTRKTLAEELRLQLADEIVRGVLEPGVALDETELSRRFGVSRTPVREAIRLLAASGLIEARPHRGAVVARPDQERLLGMFEALKELEVLCSGLATERMTGARRRARASRRSAAHSSARWVGSPNHMSSTPSSSRPSCAATATAPWRQCANILRPCARPM